MSINDIIDSWGLAGDYYAANVLKYFLRAPHNGNEEKDYRRAMSYLEKVYERDANTMIKTWDALSNRCRVIENLKLNLVWFNPIKKGVSMTSEERKLPKNRFLIKHLDITLQDVVREWRLTGLRSFFVECFYYKNFNIEACLKTLSDIIDDVSDYHEDAEEEELEYTD